MESKKEVFDKKKHRKKHSTTVNIDRNLSAKAKDLGLNTSRLCERALEKAIK